MQMKVYKQILGVQRQTTNIGVLLELGRHPLNMECIKLGLKNWEMIRGGNANELIIDCHNVALKEDLPWLVKIKEHLSEKKNGYKKMYETLTKKFQRNALSTINNPKQQFENLCIIQNSDWSRKISTGNS